MDLFSQIRIQIIRIGSGFLADPDSGKKVRSGSEKNPDPKHYKVENVLVPQIDPLT